MGCWASSAQRFLCAPPPLIEATDQSSLLLRVAGFTSVPDDLQQKILNLHLAGPWLHKCHSTCPVQAVCRSFEAYTQLFLHAQTRLEICRTGPKSTAALLPYSPHVQSLSLVAFPVCSTYWSTVITGLVITVDQ